jgi:WD40 repeat protein
MSETFTHNVCLNHRGISAVAFSPDGKRALSGSDDHTVRLWDVDDGRCLRVLKGHSSAVWSLAWSHNGRRALSGSVDNTVRLWNVDDGRCLHVLKGHSSIVMGVAWSPDGQRALSGSYDNTLRLWDVENGRCLGVLEGHSSAVMSVAWSHDGRRALSGSRDNTVRLWDVEDGRCLRVLEGHSLSVLSVAWSHDGRRALSGASDKTVRLWDVEDGRCLRVLEGHSLFVVSVAWSHDEQRAFSAAASIEPHFSEICVWDLASSELTEGPSPEEAQVQYINAKVQNQEQARQMQQEGQIKIDNESRELILVGHVFAIAGAAGQIYRGYTNSDHGIDGEIEFKNDKGRATGKKLYLQLKSGDSYLTYRQRDEAEVFQIKNPRWVEYWQQQAYPVMLVIRTSDGHIRWMDVSDWLKRHTAGGKTVTQIIFEGERFDALTLRRWRERMLA